jgi:glycosyltransferase involved in cell wall biosynthesis
MVLLGRLSEKELIDEYQKCDALLFPSRFEGFGYVALEAMSCGKPVVATDSSSIPEVVENGVSGLLCPIDDIEAFVNACSQLEENKELCVKTGEEGSLQSVGGKQGIMCQNGGGREKAGCRGILGG